MRFSTLTDIADVVVVGGENFSFIGPRGKYWEGKCCTFSTDENGICTFCGFLRTGPKEIVGKDVEITYSPADDTASIRYH